MSKKSIRDSMWLYGKHAVNAAINNPQREILKIVVSEHVNDMQSIRKKTKAKIEIADKNFFSSKFGKDATHQGIAALVKCMPDLSIEDITSNEDDCRPIIALDRVTDPQNIGSILRAAAVFGIRAIVLTENNSPELSSLIAKIASGATEVVPLVYVTNLVHTLKELQKKGFWSVGLDERAQKNMHETKLDGKIVLVIGSEGDGMRRLTRETCDFLVKLPYKSEFSTLNAAQAATVSMYEILRQQMDRK